MRIPEKQIRIAALKALYTAKGNKLSTSQLIVLLSISMNPSGRDNEIINGRGDTYFSQKVRNLVCHRNQSLGFEQTGFAEYEADSESWTLTALGRRRAASIN